MDAVVRYRHVHVPTFWLVLLLAALLAVTVVLVASSVKLTPVVQASPASPAVPHPTMSGEFAKLPFA